MEATGMNWEPTWQQALPYGPFLEAHAEQRHRDRWQKVYDELTLDASHRALLSTFTRKMHLLCIAGAWCGDCVLQGPILQKIAEVNPAIELRFVDRDKHSDAQDEVQINAGRRVPVVVFLAEDFYEIGRFGERTLSTYRKMASERLGPSCPTGIVPPSSEYVAAVTTEWMNEVERMQLLLRLSPRLRQKHGD
jgi:thiol-disulfide isomerase/thioredoxin